MRVASSDWCASRKTVSVSSILFSVIGPSSTSFSQLPGFGWPARDSPLLHRDITARVLPQIDLAWPGDLLLAIQKQLLPRRKPTGRARNREKHGEHLLRESHRLVNDAGIEVHIRVEFSLDEVLIFQGNPLELDRDVEQRILARNLEYLVGYPLDDFRPRVVVLVHPVAKTHKLTLTCLHLLYELRNLTLGADLAEHPKHCLVCASMQRAVKSRGRRSDRAIGICLRAADTPHRIGAAVLLVVRMQDEKDFEGFLQNWIGLVLPFGHLKEHV